jgi:hypothetical protein
MNYQGLALLAVFLILLGIWAAIVVKKGSYVGRGVKGGQEAAPNLPPKKPSRLKKLGKIALMVAPLALL